MSGEFGPTCGYQWWAEQAGVVSIPGPWSGTLDEQIDAANAAAIAQCPGHGEPVMVLEPA